MQHLFLSGEGASHLSRQLVTALNTPFSGFLLSPFHIGGQIRGEALRLIPSPPPPRLNNVPCRIRLTQTEWLLLPRVMEEIAVPGLCSALNAHTPMLLDAIHSEMLSCPSFCDALIQVQSRECLVVFVVAKGAETTLKQLLPAERQRWFDTSTVTLEQLVEAAALRL